MHDAPGVLPEAAALRPGRPAGGDETAVLLPFFERLKRMPLATWMRAGMPLADGPAEHDFDSPMSAAARARLRAIVDHMPSGVRLARSRVHDYVAVAEGFAPPAIVLRMKRVALTAALALLARPHLSPAEFERLYGPFMRLIPPNQIGRTPR